MSDEPDPGDVDMEIQQLRCLVAVAEEGSFTHAAAALHVTQPTLSHAVKKLEREFGVELFNRSARGVTLTPAGETLVPRALDVLRTLESMEAAVAAIRGVATGTLYLVTPPPCGDRTTWREAIV